ncbi:MAG: TIGR03617 family F420-dependent LLM class oxidoreductase, partial [Thermoplasmata archaeon]
MKLDAFLPPTPPGEVPRLAEAAEEMGFHGLWIGETSHDSLLAAALAAEHTGRLDVGTAISLAFSKSPMALAYTAWDVQALASGRFILGLGSQVKGHMERRFSVPWVPPSPKMREVILALRAIWESWQNGMPLDFQGRYFAFNLMTPFFNPGSLADSTIPVYLAGVNPGMARLAGELCEGLHVHPFHTVRYVQEVLRPAVEEGARRAGRPVEEVAFVAPVFVAVGAS